MEHRDYQDFRIYEALRRRMLDGVREMELLKMERLSDDGYQGLLRGAKHVPHASVLKAEHIAETFAQRLTLKDLAWLQGIGIGTE